MTLEGVYHYVVVHCQYWFLFFYRAETFLKQNTGDAAALQESQNLTMFLATQGQITTKLKGKLEVLSGVDDLLCEIVDLCCNLYDQKAFILPAEKHMLLKVSIWRLFFGKIFECLVL